MNKKFSILTILCISFFSVSLFAKADALINIQRYEVTSVSPGSGITVKYSAHNSPSIKEYTEGKARVDHILKKVLGYGLEPRVSALEIGICPKAMRGGNIVEEDGKLYISITSSDDEIEGALLGYFSFVARNGQLVFFANNNPTLAQLKSGKEKVELAIQRFYQAGLNLVLPERLEIGISPKTMRGGNIVEENGKLYISVTSSDTELERYFIKYVRE